MAKAKQPAQDPTPSAPPAETPRKKVAVQAAPAAPPSVEALVKEMELPDSSFDADLDLPPDDLEPEAPVEAARERDPDTGRFLPKAEPKHNPVFVEEAKNLGISEQVLATLSPDELKDAINLKASLRHAHVERDVPKTPAAPEPEGADPFSEFKPEEYDQWMRNLVQEVRELRKLAPRLQQVEQFAQHTTNVSINERLDRFFAKHPDIYGQGSYAEITAGTPEFIRRDNAARYVREYLAKEPGTLEGKMQKAHEVLYPGAKAPPPAPTPQASNGHSRISKEDWDAAPLAKPTQRTGAPEPKGTARAERAVAQKLREMNSRGVSLDLGPEESGLPD